METMEGTPERRGLLFIMRGEERGVITTDPSCKLQATCSIPSYHAIVSGYDFVLLESMTKLLIIHAVAHVP